MIYDDIEIGDSSVVREFGEKIDPIELKWHRDDEDRAIISIHETDWMIQLEDRLPQNLNDLVFIERGQWHRLIKGNGKLLVKIIKGDGFNK